MRKWNQFSLFRQTSTKVIPIEKMSTMSQVFKRGSKWRTSSLTNLFLDLSKYRYGAPAFTWHQYSISWCVYYDDIKKVISKFIILAKICSQSIMLILIDHVCGLFSKSVFRFCCWWLKSAGVSFSFWNAS